MTALLIFLALQMPTATLPFDEAKAQADSYESSLAQPAKSALVKAQRSSIDAAFKRCGHLAESPIQAFTVVAHVSAIGTTDKTWLKGSTALARCVEQQLATASLPVNGGRSFYTSYEFTFAP